MPTQNRNRQGTPNSQPGREENCRGTGPVAQEARELLVQCLHSHPHTIRRLDSLNNVDRPPQQFGRSPVCSTRAFHHIEYEEQRMRM